MKWDWWTNPPFIMNVDYPNYVLDYSRKRDREVILWELGNAAENRKIIIVNTNGICMFKEF